MKTEYIGNFLGDLLDFSQLIVGKWKGTLLVDWFVHFTVTTMFYHTQR